MALYLRLVRVAVPVIAAARKLLKQNLRLPVRKAPSLLESVPTIQPRAWSESCCRVCGIASPTADLCVECRVPISVRELALRMLIKVRSPGLWRAAEDFDTPVVVAYRLCPEFGPNVELVADDLLPHNARYLAALNNAAPELLDEIDRLRAENAELRKELSNAECGH